MGCIWSDDQTITCGTCAFHIFNSNCQWNYAPETKTYQCRCAISNQKYSKVEIQNKMLLLKDSDKMIYYFPCPSGCGSLLFIHNWWHFSRHALYYINLDKRLTRSEMTFTRNCSNCKRTGVETYVEKQTFRACATCGGTGGLRCMQHIISKTYLQNINDFVDNKCDHCQESYSVGFVKRCATCNGMGQFCEETVGRRSCTKCINMSCREFLGNAFSRLK